MIPQLLKTLLECFLIIVFTQVPLFVLWVNYQATTEQTTALASLLAVVDVIFQPGAALVYITNLLASSWVYYAMNFGFGKVSAFKYLIGVTGPLILIFLGAGIYEPHANGEVENYEFVNSYALMILAISFLIWYLCLFWQRRFESSSFNKILDDGFSIGEKV